MGSSKHTDIVIVGGGLAGALLAYRLKTQRPELSFALLQNGDDFPRHATWSFHRSDIGKENWPWLEPLVTHEWPGYTVRMPDYERNLCGSSYCTIRSADFFERLGIESYTKFNAKVSSIAEQSVYLEGGDFLTGNVVIDARGWAPEQGRLCGWQKFVGIDLELESPHKLERPLLKDTTIEQKDGYRFFYLLPWSAKRLLVEDTRYSASQDFSVEEYTEEIISYVQRRGWHIKRIERVESAALPIPLLEPKRRGKPEIPSIGMAGAFFHRVTGYSLPWAVRIADCLSRLDDYNPQAVTVELGRLRRSGKRMNEFSLLLNRMMFCAADPEERLNIFTRFYRLPEGLIQRFYADQMTVMDMARVLVGKPPVKVKRALRVVRARENLQLC